MYYYGARYYAPWLGRWASVDMLPLVGANQFAFASCNPSSHADVWGLYDPSALGRRLEESLSSAEESAHRIVGDRNVLTSVANTLIATSATLIRGSLGVFQIGTGTAQGWEGIQRGFGDQGDAWDVAIGVSRILSDAGEVASTALGAAGTGAKAAQAGKVALIKREITIVKAERAAATGTEAAKLSERLGELNARSSFIGAGYESAGNLKRVPKDPTGNVRQGVDQGYRSMKPFNGTDVVVEAKGLAKAPGSASQARVLKSDTNGLVEGAADWNLDRLEQAAQSGNANARSMLDRLAGDAPESYLSVTRTGFASVDGPTISRLMGATGRPVASPLSSLPSVSPAPEMVGSMMVDRLVSGVIR